MRRLVSVLSAAVRAVAGMGRLLEPGGDIGPRSMIEAAPPGSYRDGTVQNPAYRFAAANKPPFVQTEGGFCWLSVHVS